MHNGNILVSCAPEGGKEMVNNSSNLRFMLHVSDFHLTDSDDDLNIAKAALNAIAQKLREEKIKIDYLVHTGDIIDSTDFHKIAYNHVKHPSDVGKHVEKSDFSFEYFTRKATPAEKEVFNCKIDELTHARFDKAKLVVSHFMSEINVAPGNVVICCGNHDAMRKVPLSIEAPLCEKLTQIAKEPTDTKKTPVKPEEAAQFPSQEDDSFRHFNWFLNELKVANSPVRCEKEERSTGAPVEECTLDNLNFLIINTNWQNPDCMKPGNYCIHCRSTCQKIKEILDKDKDAIGELNIVAAHKPIYEICEDARLSYKNYRKTEFMSKLYDYLGENGIYLCGDKHTRSVVGASFHDVPHYISGEPLHVKNNESDDYEAEYNLLGIADGKLGMERKIHLWSKNGVDWSCDICPQDDTVSDLYNLSKKHISPESYEQLPATNSRNTWEALNQVLFSQEKADPNLSNSNVHKELIHACEITKDKDLDQLFKAASKYRRNGKYEIKWKKTDRTCATTNSDNIFVTVAGCIAERMQCSNHNVLNLRGKYSSGKSTFLGLLYIYLLRLYSIGKINFIPAYFALENAKMLEKVKKNTIYYDAVKNIFDDFVKSVQKIAHKEHQPVCYIIDRVDTQDCWSYSSEDSVGRGLLDILSKYDNAWYIFSFGEHNLPLFKNTMSARIYSEDSDVMYFNPIDVRDENYHDADNHFYDFVSAFLAKKGFKDKFEKFCNDNTDSIDWKLIDTEKHRDALYSTLVSDVCTLIRRFRRLDIDFGFMRQHADFLTTLTVHDSKPRLKNISLNVDQAYSYYIDRQYERCMDRLHYGFVNYAPAMAFLFSYQGYTYERFRQLRDNNELRERHDMKLICDNQDKIYNAFMFIKKHQDAREYLTAMYYHRELRFYAENPQIKIENDSILNEFITRNVAVLIRKMWIDTNKFIIVCNKLLEREEISNCTLSMLLYCLSHISIYEPTRIELLEKIRDRSITALTRPPESIRDQRIISADDKESIEETFVDRFDSFWEIKGSNGKQRLDYFLNLSLLHTLVLYGAMGSDALEKMMDQLCQKNNIEYSNGQDMGQSEVPVPNPNTNYFACYNRQHQMLYYQDLSIWGEHKKRALDPGTDTIYKGLDFFNCLNYLCVKINDVFRTKYDYTLLTYDVLSLCNLLDSRLLVDSRWDLKKDVLIKVYPNKDSDKKDTFFYWEAGYENVKPILEYVEDTLKKYIEKVIDPHRSLSKTMSNRNMYILRIYDDIKARREVVNTYLDQNKVKSTDKNGSPGCDATPKSDIQSQETPNTAKHPVQKTLLNKVTSFIKSIQPADRSEDV